VQENAPKQTKKANIRRLYFKQ